MRYLPTPEQAGRLTPEELRTHFLVSGLFEPGEARFEMVDLDRVTLGGVVPLGEPIHLTAPDEFAAKSFTERRMKYICPTCRPWAAAPLTITCSSGPNIIRPGTRPPRILTRVVCAAAPFMGAHATRSSNAGGWGGAWRSSASANARVIAGLLWEYPLRPESSTSVR